MNLHFLIQILSMIKEFYAENKNKTKDLNLSPNKVESFPHRSTFSIQLLQAFYLYFVDLFIPETKWISKVLQCSPYFAQIRIFIKYPEVDFVNNWIKVRSSYSCFPYEFPPKNRQIYCFHLTIWGWEGIHCVLRLWKFCCKQQSFLLRFWTSFHLRTDKIYFFQYSIFWGTRTLIFFYLQFLF